jgi:NIMA (never in mitosis gene a)-related kinase
MEGANLYDVFQKISKGDYEPLPADHFSSTLRQLVLRMLQVCVCAHCADHLLLSVHDK